MDIKQYADMAPWEWPDNLGEDLLKLLGDADADTQDRLTAVSMAGDPCLVNDALAEALIAIVKDAGADESLRGRAAIALGPALEGTDLMMELEEDEDEEEVSLSKAVFDGVQGALERCYRDSGCPKEVRRRCLEASVRAPREWHPEAVRSAYRSGDAEWRLTAVFAMSYIEGFDQQILESLEDDDPDIQYEAVSGAGSWALDAAWGHIAALLEAQATDTDLCLAAMEAAVNIRPEKTADLLEPLTRHSDPEIADAAREAIEMADAMLRLDDDEYF